RAGGLERLAGLMPSSSDLLDLLARVGRSIRVRGQIHDTQIHTEEVLDLDGGIFGDLDRGVEVELASGVDKIHLALDPVEPPALVLAEDHRDDLAAFQGRETDFVEPLEAENALVIGDRAAWLERRARRLVSPKCVHRLADGPHRELGRKPEALTD